MSANKGYLNTDTRDIRIDGDVIADDGEFKIQTDTLNYEHKRRVLVATKPVQIFGNYISFECRFSLVRFDVSKNNL